MNRQELLKQANYTFQRGNRELAQKLLAELLAKYPNDEAAWLMLARAVTQRERKVECYERVLKLNPRHVEAKQELVRVQFPGYTYKDRQGVVPESSGRISPGFKRFMQVAFGLMAVLLVFTSTTFAIAKANPQMAVAKLLTIVNLGPQGNPAASDLVNPTGDNIVKQQPQGSPIIDALVALVADGTANGTDGAPTRPGVEIVPSDSDADQALGLIQNAALRSDKFVSLTLTQQQITSMITKGLKENPQVPLQDVQVYLNSGQFQVWGMLQGQSSSTPVLAVCTINLDAGGTPSIKVLSMQVGSAQVSDTLLSQVESWINQMIVDDLNRQASGYRFTEIAIGSGVVTISATR